MLAPGLLRFDLALPWFAKDGRKCGRSEPGRHLVTMENAMDNLSHENPKAPGMMDRIFYEFTPPNRNPNYTASWQKNRRGRSTRSQPDRRNLVQRAAQCLMISLGILKLFNVVLTCWKTHIWYQQDDESYRTIIWNWYETGMSNQRLKWSAYLFLLYHTFTFLGVNRACWKTLTSQSTLRTKRLCSCFW